MRRRIATAIVGVTAFILVAVGLPLALVAQRLVVRSEVVELQAIAAQTLTEVERPIDIAQLSELRSEPDAPPAFAIYDARGALLFGDGPEPADSAVIGAQTGSTTTTTTGAIVVATPVTDPDENVVGVLRISRSLNAVNSQVQQVWLAIVGVGLIAIGCSWLIADRLGRRLATPIVELADTARRTAVGGVLEAAPPTGIEEIDQLHVALVDSSARINDALARERQFSADVSHQLRTPIAALRLQLDAAHQSGEISESTLNDLSRLEETVDHLLAMARDAQPVRATCALDVVVADAVARWVTPGDATGRRIAANGTAGDVDASAPAMSQVLDVLIDNALQHGRGDVAVTLRQITGGVAVDVCDEGALSTSLPESQLFARHHGTNHGIGLALARSITQAEGGQLVLGRRDPTTFSVLLITSGSDGDATGLPSTSDASGMPA